MNMFKRIVAFAIAMVMICGMLPVSAMAEENHSHDHSVHSDIQPFTGTADLIAQVQAMLVQEGAFGAEEADQELIEAVEEMSGYAYSQASTTLALGFFNDRVGSEGRIDTAHLNLDEDTMSSLVEKTLKAYHLDGIVEVDYVVKYGVVDAVTFSMRESFAAGLDQIDTGITSIGEVDALAAAAETEAEPVVEETEETEEPVVTGGSADAASQTNEKKFPFTDVPNWARTAVNYLYQRDIVNGVSATKYGSNQSVTRGQAVTMIYRAMGSPKVEGKNPFRDVASGKFYTDAVIWAASNGVVTGTSTTTFEPNASVTREQLVTIIYRLADEYMGMDVSEKASLSKFTDGGRVAKYAQEAVKWAVGTELVNGYTDGTFRPKNVANRAEYAQVLYKFLTMHTHELTEVKAKAATCTENGNTAYWSCECGMYFSDANGTKAIEKDSWVIKATGHKLTAHAAKAPNCTDAGNTAYWSCSNCGKYFSDAEAKTEIKKDSWIIEANGHKWGAWEQTEEGDKRTCEVCGFVQICDHSALANATEATFNWVETPDYIEVAPGEYGLNPEVFFLDENGYPLMEYDNQGNPVGPVTVGAYPDGSSIISVTLVMQQNADTGEYEIGVMPTRIPDIYIDWNDTDGNGMMDEDEIAAAEVHTRMAWNCTTADVVCPNCGFAKPNTNVTVEQIFVDDAYIEQMATNSAMGAMMADEAAMATFQAAMGEMMAGGMSQEEAQTNAFYVVLQNHPNVYAAMNQTIGQLTGDYHSVLYTATVTLSDTNAISDTMNATATYLSRSWATMCSFNEAYAKYFGAATPYWTTKNEEEGPMSAFRYVLNMQEEPVIPNFIMDYYMSMLTQAFMSYVQSYSEALDAMLADAMAAVDHDELDELDKMLILHDWLAAYGEFDMQSLVDQQTGASAGSDPITMTAFGTLLHEQLGIDGAVCLGYAATYALLLQTAFDKVTTEDPIVDFVQIKYLTNVAQSSIAAGDSGFGDGDAMFNAPHFLNAVKYGDNWYYIDACYDDINSEVVSQERVETDGNVSHNSFLLAPSTWEEMYDGNYQLMDSLYDGKDWVRIPDGQGGYKMQDNKGNVYETQTEAENARDTAEENGETLQIFFVYEPQTDSKETRYEDTTYEMAWFAGIEGAVTYDPETQYFYYTAGAITNYTSMKDMFGDSENGDSGMSMDQDDMLAYKAAPSAQDKIVRRPVGAENEPEQSSSGMGMSMGAPADDECEVLFHFGYGSTGAAAQAKYEEDSENTGTNTDSSISEEDKGPWYAETQDDQYYMSNYPEISHSTVMIDGQLFFNMGNCIYTFNYDVDEMATNAIDAIETLELVKVKEYNSVTYTVNQPANANTGAGRFTGKEFVTASRGTTLYYHPIAGLSVHNDFVNGAEGEPTLHVSIATNFSNSYKPDDADPYEVQARHYNPDYYRFMEEQESAEGANDNVEFMWTASIVDRMTVANFTSDLAATSGTNTTVAAYCGRDGFTEERTSTCGLSIPGTKTVNENAPALDHQYAMDEDEGTNICSKCLEDHEHDYSYATADDIDIVWEVVTETVTNEDGTTSTVEALTATAVIVCGNDAYCAEDIVLEPGVEHESGSSLTLTDNENGTWTATVKHGTVEKTETKTIEALNHDVHDYGAPVFTWTEGEEGWTATATFTCEADEADCAHSDAEGERVVTVECAVETDENGHAVATVDGPDGQSYSDTLHVYSNAKGEDGKYLYITEEVVGTQDSLNVTYKCTVCDHTHTVSVVIVADTSDLADCTEGGTVIYTASAGADAVLTGTETQTDGALPAYEYNVTETVNALGHDLDDGTAEWSEDKSTCTVTFKCQRAGCDYTETVEATVTTEITTEPTCTEDGVKSTIATVELENVTYIYTHPETEVVPATGHTHAEAVKENEIAPDCVNSGSYDSVVYCSVCEEEVSRTKVVLEKTGHKYVDGVCSVCGEKDPDYVAPHQHAFGDWSVTTPATCTAEGVETRSCECGEKETRPIEKAPHDFSAGGETCANCTEPNPDYVAPTQPDPSTPPEEDGGEEG